ncbi:MAG: Immunoglobulin (CD79A) binding protein 1 [Marteilia pararefringens]
MSDDDNLSSGLDKWHYIFAVALANTNGFSHLLNLCNNQHQLLDFIQTMSSRRVLGDEELPQHLNLPFASMKFNREEDKIVPFGRETILFITKKLSQLSSTLHNKINYNFSDFSSEDKREFYILCCVYYFYFSYQELNHIMQEIEILKYRKNLVNKPHAAKNLPSPSNPSMKTVFINNKTSKSDLITQFSYRASPTYSVEQFYDQLKAKSSLDTPVPLDEILGDEEKIRRDEDIEYYDNTKVYELRQKDLFHDECKRGQGNIHGKG